MAHTLLLADDSVTIQRVVELTFAGEDIRIVSVGNGQQALDRLADDPPDIVLADIGMPLLDGYAVASFVRNHDALRDVPVLLMVGAFDPVDEDRVQASGAAGVLVKPFEPTLVISRVKELLRLGARPEPAAAGTLTTVENVEAVDRVAAADHSSAPDVSAEAATVGEAFPPEKTGATATDAGTPAVVDAAPRPEVTASDPPAEPAVAAALAPAWPSSDAAEGTASPDDQPVEPLPASADGASSPVDAFWGEVGLDSLSASVPDMTSQSGSSVADAFTALLAVEQGEFMPAVASPALDIEQMEALVEDVTARVAERLSTAAVRERVDRIVVEVAERLVRDEIARIRDAASANHG